MPFDGPVNPISLGDIFFSAPLNPAQVLRCFHFPFSILRLSFAIARNRTGQAMTNDKRKMENGK